MNKNGFTILELLAVIFIITIGILTAYGVVQRVTSYTSEVSFRIRAVYLAKEGVELVRNIRDTNWTDPVVPAWNEGLAVGEYEIDYDDSGLSSCSGCTFASGLSFLKVDDGFYNYSLGTESKFKRKINLTQAADDELTVVVDVFWEDKQGLEQLTVQEILYDWK